MANIVRKEMYVKSDVGNNNNKFWRFEQFDDHTVICYWGRVGDSGQNKTFPHSSEYDATKFIEKKIKEKTSDGRNDEIAYRKIDVVGDVKCSTTQSAVKTVDNTSLHRLAQTQIKKNNPLVDDLVKYLIKVNVHQITSATAGKVSYNDTTGLFSTPLGVITQENIDKANDLLTEIADFVANNNYNEKKLIPLTNDYLMLVPQVVPRHGLNVRDFWADTSKLQYQKQILDGLQASFITVNNGGSNAVAVSKSKQDVEEKVFDLKLELVEDAKTISWARHLYDSTKASNHASASGYKFKTIYDVTIKGERERFENHGRKIGNVRDLFHGSSASNLISIMKQGLIIPPTTSKHVCGRMFSDGLYFASSSTKSLNYSLGVWGGQRTDRVFMFIANVALGKAYTPRSSGESLPKPGYDSTWAKAGYSGVIHDEFIVYDLKQATLRYLIELQPT